MKKRTEGFLRRAYFSNVSSGMRSESKIHATWEEVIQFITWHNNQPKDK